MQWGSSCAVGNGGRVGTPTPTKYGNLSNLSVGADDLGGPRAHTVCPYGRNRTGSVGSAKPGANAEPHHLKFSTKPGPLWARREMKSTTQISRAGNVLLTSRGDPRNRGPGADSPCQGEMARRARGGRESRHWRTEFASAASPGDSLVTFSSLRKSLAARRRRNSPAKNGSQRRRVREAAPYKKEETARRRAPPCQ